MCQNCLYIYTGKTLLHTFSDPSPVLRLFLLFFYLFCQMQKVKSYILAETQSYYLVNHLSSLSNFILTPLNRFLMVGRKTGFVGSVQIYMNSCSIAVKSTNLTRGKILPSLQISFQIFVLNPRGMEECTGVGWKICHT